MITKLMCYYHLTGASKCRILLVVKLFFWFNIALLYKPLVFFVEIWMIFWSRHQTKFLISILLSSSSQN